MKDREEIDLAKIMNDLLVKLNQFIGWRRNFTIAVVFLLLVLGLAIWNNNRVQACDQNQIVTRSYYSAQGSAAEVKLWEQIKELIDNPRKNPKAGQAILDQDIVQFESAQRQLSRHRIGACSWFG